jgi:glucose-1-phosphate adenylyltransferase
MNAVLSLILAGGRGKGLSVLTEQRAKPVIPFGGKYRTIDFALSNLANSHLERIAVLAQSNWQSIAEHLGDGKVWAKGGIPIWLPGMDRTGMEAYRGTADAVYQNRKWIAESGCEWVLILAGDHIYSQDFNEMIRFHQERDKALTIATIEVSAADAGRFGMMQVDADHKIVAFVEKPGQSQWTHASMGIYIFNTAYLLEALDADALDAASTHDFGNNIIPKIVAAGKASSFSFQGSWVDISDVKAYWKANLALLEKSPLGMLDDPNWQIHTPDEARAPVKVRQDGQVTDSLLSDGCIIDGEVTGSVLSPGVTVERGAVVRRSVILRDTIIHAGALVNDCVIDERVDVGVDALIGFGEDATPNQLEPEIFSGGISVVGRGAHIPTGAVIGRNCKIAADVKPEDFKHLEVPSGSTIERK